MHSQYDKIINCLTNSLTNKWMSQPIISRQIVSVCTYGYRQIISVGIHMSYVSTHMLSSPTKRCVNISCTYVYTFNKYLAQPSRCVNICSTKTNYVIQPIQSNVLLCNQSVSLWISQWNSIYVIQHNKMCQHLEPYWAHLM